MSTLIKFIYYNTTLNSNYSSIRYARLRHILFENKVRVSKIEQFPIDNIFGLLLLLVVVASHSLHSHDVLIARHREDKSIQQTERFLHRVLSFGPLNIEAELLAYFLFDLVLGFTFAQISHKLIHVVRPPGYFRHVYFNLEPVAEQILTRFKEHRSLRIFEVNRTEVLSEE